MAKKKAAPPGRQPATGRGLYRESIYLHGDELAAVEAYAKRQRCSKAEAIRRAVRAFLKAEDQRYERTVSAVPA